MNHIVWMRISLGFLLAPVIALTFVAAFVCASLYNQNEAISSFTLCFPGATFMLSGFGSLLAYPVALVLGAPVFMVLRAKGWLDWWQVGVGSLFVGLTGAVVLPFAIPPGRPHWETVASFLPICCGVGVLAGLVFWVIAIWRNHALTAGTTGGAPQAGRA
jgi:hypothetical protein